MNVQRFVGKNAREAMAQARAMFGDQTVVLSNRPVPGGVEILAMAGGDVPAPKPGPARQASAPPMSTLSFQEFVRERMRQEEGAAQPRAAATEPPQPQSVHTPEQPGRFAAEALAFELASEPQREAQRAAPAVRAFTETAQAPMDADVLGEIKAMRSMIASQLAGLSWFDSVRRSPVQTMVLRLLIGNGFSTQVARQLVQRVPQDTSEAEAERWLLGVLTQNLRCAEADSIQEKGGVFALVGPTGVGKTTTTAKIAANFAMKHGAASVGLITVDTYRMAASDQLRAFGRILNIPVHTARDGASLADLLNLFVKKKLVLIDTVGVGQRDRRLAELTAALPADRIERLLVLNASAQGETLDEVAQAYSTGPGTRCVISKLDEAVKCGAAIDVVLRHQLKVEGFANGQRVPEDWHAARPHVLVQKALMKPAVNHYTPDDTELGLLLTTPPAPRARLGGQRA
jgi:flagellar biosynthesis protein FlhF